jgi:hypothetical protein
MFWLGIIIALIAGLVGIGVSREKAKARLPWIRDFHLDWIAIVLLILGLVLSAYDHWTTGVKMEHLHASVAQHEFTPLSLDLRASVLKALGPIAVSFGDSHITIAVTHETWVTPTTRQFATELVTLLRDAGFNVSGPDFATVYLASPSFPIEWGFNKNQEESVDKLFSALSRIIVPSARGAVRRTLPVGDVRIHIAGKPKFHNDGSVEVE